MMKTRSGSKWIPGVLTGGLFLLVLLAAPSPAAAHCCGLTANVGCCNVFGCNCDGPCSNFGCSCPPPRYQVGVGCGSCNEYPVCESSFGKCKYCGPGTHCCEQGCCANSADDAGSSQLSVTPRQESRTSQASRPPFQEVGPESPEDRFRRFDRDGSGGVSWDEVVAAYRKLRLRVDKKLLRETFERTDTNGNGILEPGEADASLAN